MISLHNVTKRYPVAGDQVVALDDVSLRLAPGDFVCLRGESGSGKTTLLLTIGGMQRPTSGVVAMADQPDFYALSSAARTRVRAQEIGFVFQLFHLVPYLNVIENIELGAMAGRNGRAETDRLIDRLALDHRLRHHPAQLSVGERQRVAVARALRSRPRVILADEPTGNLDSKNAGIVIDALREFCTDGGILLLATHSESLPAAANRQLTIKGGVVTE